MSLNQDCVSLGIPSSLSLSNEGWIFYPPLRKEQMEICDVEMHYPFQKLMCVQGEPKLCRLLRDTIMLRKRDLHCYSSMRYISKHMEILHRLCAEMDDLIVVYLFRAAYCGLALSLDKGIYSPSITNMRYPRSPITTKRPESIVDNTSMDKLGPIR